MEAHIPTQPPFAVDADLLAFNGSVVHGHKEILAQVYAARPPGAFVLRFRLSRQGGLFGTVLSTELPQATRSWAYLTSFQMTLHRTCRHAGVERSFVSAACSAPAGFPGAVFPFAKATYGFAGGRHVRASVVRSCHVEGVPGLGHMAGFLPWWPASAPRHFLAIFDEVVTETVGAVAAALRGVVERALVPSL